MKLVEIAIKKPVLIIVLFTLLIGGGLFCYSLLGYELIPRFSQNTINITTFYPGASPHEIENTVTKKIEDAISSLENIKKIEKDLPKDADPPSLSKISLSDVPIVTMSASAKMDETEFYDLVDKKIAPSLSRINGVAQVYIVGGQEREIQVSLNDEKLKGYGLSVPQVQQAILNSNLDFPTGNVQTREQRMLVRLSGKYKTVDEMRNLVISSVNCIQVRLGELADVQDAQKDVDKIARGDQKSALVLQIVKQSDANAVAVSKGVKASIKKITADYASIEMDLKVVNDTSDFTLTAANSVIHDLFIAVLLVALVMFFFLHSIRNSLIVMVSIPASLIATFIGIYALGYTLNLMSLLGLSLVVGILVDDAIVVIENIYRHMEMGKNRVRAAYDGTAEIGFTVTAITIVIVVVFLPIALSTGLVSNIIKQFCVTVIMATLLSLLSSFTLVPWLSSRFGKLEHIEGKNFFGKIILAFEKGLTAFTHWISNLLESCLKFKKTTLAVVVALFAGSLYLLIGGYVGTEFFPKADRGEFLVQIELPKNASIEETNLIAQQAEAYLSKKKKIATQITTIGQVSEGQGSTTSTAYKGEIDVKLIDKKLRDDNSTVYAAKIKRELETVLVGAKIKTVPVGLVGTADNAPLALVIKGSSLDSAMVFANQAVAALKNVQGASEIKLSVDAGNPEINVQVDRDKMAALGLTLQTVGGTMQTAFGGNTDGKYRAGGYEYDINIRYASFNRSNINDVSNLEFINSANQPIKLSQFATVKESSGPSLLERRDKSASVTIQAQTIGRATGTIANEWQASFEKLPKPVGVSYVWSGDQENQSDGFGSLGAALVAAILLVYLVMVALYNNFVYPFVALFSIPLSFIGALLALALTNNSLNVFTILGVIMLIGLVCKNAILLVDFTNQRKAEGQSTHNALIQSIHARLRPILMTTIAMVFGMLPIALATGAAAELNSGLAWVIIGGLISSLFLTLVVVPVIYAIFDGFIAKANKGKERLDLNELMVETYTAARLSEDGFTP
ncbi:MAG: efflux RND transporter permease subunit, partial [Panacibacter sp.]